jgi:hypothetical protein
MKDEFKYHQLLKQKKNNAAIWANAVRNTEQMRQYLAGIGCSETYASINLPSVSEREMVESTPHLPLQGAAN